MSAFRSVMFPAVPFCEDGSQMYAAWLLTGWFAAVEPLNQPTTLPTLLIASAWPSTVGFPRATACVPLTKIDRHAHCSATPVLLKVPTTMFELLIAAG